MRAVSAIMIPVTLMFASLGLLLGAVFSTPALNGVGSIIINLSALLSGTWFSLEMVGGKFRTFCLCLPFAHAVNAASGAMTGNFEGLALDLVWILGYTALFLILGALIFRKRMKN